METNEVTQRSLQVLRLGLHYTSRARTKLEFHIVLRQISSQTVLALGTMRVSGCSLLYLVGRGLT